MIEGYSPQQISGWAKRAGIEMVSHETIYLHIWEDKRNNGTLYTYLRRRGRVYRKRGYDRNNRGQIKNRVDISKRSPIVDKKERLGDLEIDTVIGKNHKSVILTINDRRSGYVWIRKLKSKNAKQLALKTIAVLKPYKKRIHTITSDNGKEFACHQLIKDALGIEFYFASPYASWQRGANENTNGLIRQYFPKGTDFSRIPQKKFKQVQDILNNRPRYRLDYDTPNNVWNSQID